MSEDARQGRATHRCPGCGAGYTEEEIPPDRKKLCETRDCRVIMFEVVRR